MKKQKKKIVNNEVEDRDIFIKIDPDISLESKKELLEISESLIETQIAAENFKQQRKDEMRVRLMARKNIKETVSALSKMLSELPKDIKVKVKEEKEAPAPRARVEKPLPKVEIIREEEAEKEKKETKKEEVKTTKMSDLQAELENIRSKLSGLK